MNANVCIADEDLNEHDINYYFVVLVLTRVQNPFCTYMVIC